MSRIFLSHSSLDEEAVLGVRDWLIGEGWDDLFLDLDAERGLVAGQRWQNALKAAAERCELVLFLITPNWVASKWCLAEFLLARNMNKHIFGIIVKPTPFEDLPVEMTAEWQLVDLTSGELDQVFDIKLGSGSKISQVRFNSDGLQRLKIGLLKAGLDTRFFEWSTGRPPYRGLRVLEEEDAGIFFGRDGQIVDALDRLRGLREGAAPRLLSVLGASGSGKSSFMRAGLLPRLARDDRHFLVLPVIRPQAAAITGESGLIESLLGAFRAQQQKVTKARIRSAIADGGDEVGKLLEELVQKVHEGQVDSDVKGARPPSIIIPVDQAEELYIVQANKEAEAFTHILKELVSGDRPATIGVLTIRTDAYEHLQEDRVLGQLRQQSLSLPPMPHGSYEEVIRGPLRRLEGTERAIKIDDTLVEALLRDIEEGGAKDALPLLAFTLERLYQEYGGDGDLRLGEYEELGRIRGSIEAAVEDALKRADSDPVIPKDRESRLALLRRGLVPWLAGVDPETGGFHRKVAKLSQIPEEARPLMLHLVESRLLATDMSKATKDAPSEPTIEPAHEALLRQWGLLEGWLKEDFEALSSLKGVQRASLEWDANNRSSQWLAHTAGRLESAEKYAAREDLRDHLTQTDTDYLHQARQSEDVRKNQEIEAQKQITRRTRLGLIAATFLTIIAGGFAWYGLQQAEIAEGQKLIAEQQRSNAETAAIEAARQKDLAEQQTKKAESALKSATSAANTLVFELARDFTDSSVPGQVILSILEKARELQEKLATNFPDDPQLQLSKLAALIELGNLNLRLKSLDDALSAFEEGMVIARRLAALDENNAEWQRAASINLGRIGDVKLQSGDTLGALTAYKEGVGIAVKLAALDKNNTQWHWDVTTNLIRIGDVKLRSGDAAGALVAYEESIVMRRMLAALDEDNAEWQRAITVSLTKIGDVKLRSGDAAGALASFDESMVIARRLAALDKNNTRWQRDVSIIVEKIGDVKLRSGDAAGALIAYEEGMAIRSKLVVLDKNNTQWQRDVLVGLNNIGDVKLRSGDTAGALASYDEGMVIARKLAALDENNPQWQRGVSIILNKIGDVNQRSGDAAGALVAYDEGMVIVRRLVALDKNNPEWQRDVSILLNKIGDVKLRSDDVPGALASYDEGMVIARGLAALDGNNPQWQRDVLASLDKIGDVKLRSGDAVGALTSYDEAMVIARRLVALDENNPQWQRGVSVGLDNIGDIKLQSGDADGALAAYEEALVIARRLAALDENNSQWQRDVLSSFDKIGRLYEKGEKYQLAYVQYNALYDHSIELSKRFPKTRAFRDVSDYARGKFMLLAGAIGYSALFSRDFATSEQKFLEAIKFKPNLLLLKANLAHALLFQGKLDAAVDIYLKHKGKMIGKKTWEETILGGFKDLRLKGIIHPHMLEVERLFAE